VVHFAETRTGALLLMHYGNRDKTQLSWDLLWVGG